ncbi:MAG: chemotaxis protein CheA [gamma proteobacterium symbiont of Taylorina sp.]|nr:chemotaxis protein CheA [gamma proteobacterium symbiont of Taylorina sp.]
MSIDLSQFKQTFLEESDEGLDVLESGLLALDSGTADDEVIHAVFRAAHSIKGGAGTFGLNEIASFTHVMETLLDEMRDGRREITRDAMNVLLSSVDVLRELMDSARDEVEPEMERVNEVQAQLDAVLAGGSSDAVTSGEQGVEQETSADNVSAAKQIAWLIKFRPHEHLLRTGNDTVRMFRELSTLGDMENTVSCSELPELPHLDPELSYLSWEITLKNNAELGDIEKETIEEIFEWVDGDCDLTIEPVIMDDVSTEEVSTEDPPPARGAGSGSPGDVLQSHIEVLLAGSAEVDKSDIVSETVESAVTAPIADKVVPITARTAKKKKKNVEGSIRVGTSKVDSLIDMVGELVITQSMLSQLGDNFSMAKLETLRSGLAQLERNTRELQESVMRIRMLPISFSFQRFPRLVHDLSQKMSKKIELKMSGEQTELDKAVMEKIGDPMVHLVRNSLDHGIESPEIRLAAGKDETGIIHLNAYHQGGMIMIEISDDGAGLPRDKLLQKAIEKGLVAPGENLSDENIYDLIFHPGFSTADQVTDVSGRGVGMDVVRKNIKELGGSVEVSTEPGQGTTFTIRLPLTLAILDGQLVQVGQETYIIPLVSIIESFEIEPEKVNSIDSANEVYKIRDEYIPMVRLYDMFDIKPVTMNLQDCLLVVVEADGRKVGLLVDDLLSQQQVVIKSLETNYKRIEGFSGATILGDGTIALILDMSGLSNLLKQSASVKNYASA